MSQDPAFHELRQKPLPTLPERRRFVRDLLAKREADLARYTRLLEEGPHSTTAKHLRKRLATAKSEVDQLTKALAYLGTPDPRLDLYRLFGMDLPTPRMREFKR